MDDELAEQIEAVRRAALSATKKLEEFGEANPGFVQAIARAAQLMQQAGQQQVTVHPSRAQRATMASQTLVGGMLMRPGLAMTSRSSMNLGAASTSSAMFASRGELTVGAPIVIADPAVKPGEDAQSEAAETVARAEVETTLDEIQDILLAIAGFQEIQAQPDPLVAINTILVYLTLLVTIIALLA